MSSETETGAPADTGNAASECGLTSVLRTPTAVVHLEYDAAAPPPAPGAGWTRFVCVSDTHTRAVRVPPGDVLLHGGDLTHSGKAAEFEGVLAWLGALPHAAKIIIAGNHDLSLDGHDGWYDRNWRRWHESAKKQDVARIRELLQGPKAAQAGIVYLEDRKYEFEAKENGRMWSIYGSPWSPWFMDWGFNYERGEEADQRVAAFPKADILLTHGPPHEILDKTIHEEHVGCESLLARLPSLRPRLHLFGHIHEDHGAIIKQWSGPGDGSGGDTQAGQTVFVNAAQWPMGPRSRGPEGKRVRFGEAPFQPVIVDLLDEV
ncbi:Metallo-dependent phosphatase [Wolfiporia cocos MD-104 SS10]|uniref:Metallo-dependent phosphatase n=1 Tax=Wolfiporia cocos (strain MD-104) TaxID=742152 RepID=A0A2H3JES7_WOLCO|nr:Metallo-dependent phosphatase [Wolfiporia cocos MD-104 SS10]